MIQNWNVIQSWNVSQSWARFLPLLLLFTLVACSSPTEEAASRLQEERDRWEDLGLDSYSFEFQRLCFCSGPLGILLIVVEDDAVVSVTEVETGQPPQNLPEGWTGTIDDIFAELLDDAATAASLELTFDDIYHFPSHARVDRIENAIDDEYDLNLADLQPG